jgi:hypothetical protein
MSTLKFKKVRSVTLPVLAIKLDTPTYIGIDSAIVAGKVVEEGKEAANIMNVTDLETGEEAQIVLNKVLMANLQETYPNDDYVGKQFEIIKFKKASGRDYHTFKIVEIQVEMPESTTAPASGKKA